MNYISEIFIHILDYLFLNTKCNIEYNIIIDLHNFYTQKHFTRI